MLAAPVWGWCRHLLNIDMMDPHLAIIGRFFLRFCATIDAMQTPQNANYQTFAHPSLGQGMPALEIQQPGHQISKYSCKYLR